MKALISINQSTIADTAVQTVNARDLHAFLEVGKDFSNWIKARIDKYGFLENQDFVVFAKTSENPQGGRPSIDYHLTLDMAKELSMVEKNAKGKQARQYFIECERQAKAVTLDPRNLTRMQLMQIAMDAERERLVLVHQVAEQAPKVEVYDRISEAADTYLIRPAAKTLGVGPGKLVDWLLTNGWVYRSGGKGYLLGYQDKLERGWLAHKLTPFFNKYTRTGDFRAALRVTAKGLTVLAGKIPTPSAA